jgi:hypothetical protein
MMRAMLHAVLRALPALLAAQWLALAPAQAQVQLGRLFATPAERQQLDANRGKTQALAPNSQGLQAEADAPGPGSGPGPRPGESDALSGKTYDGQRGDAPGARGAAAPGVAAPPGGAAATGGAQAGAAPAEAAAPEAPEALVMNGVLRTSSGRSTVWLNEVPQSAAQNKLTRRGPASPALTVTLPSGKKVVLKAGQRYDLNEGRVKDINEP